MKIRRVAMANINKSASSAYCPKCGAAFPSGSNFCGNCGYKIGKVGSRSLGSLFQAFKNANWSSFSSTVARGLDVATNWIENTIQKGVSKLFAENSSAPSFAIFNALALVFCSVPAGAIGLFYSWRVYSLKQKGDNFEAIRSSKSAKIWFFVAVVYLLIVRLPLALLR